MTENPPATEQVWVVENPPVPENPPTPGNPPIIEDPTRHPVSSWTVVDAAVLAVALTDDGPDGDRVRRRLIGCRLAAPATVDLEVLTVWQRGAATTAIPQRRIDLAMADLARMPLTRVPPVDLLTACWERSQAVGPADALYLALAEALDAPLLTADPRLAAAASRLRVELLR
jgi:predicted nucleic acid-binding protein